MYFLSEGKKKDAESELRAAETPRSSLTAEVTAPTSTPIDPVTAESTASTNKGRLGRPRKKKSFGDDFVHDENQGQWQIMCLFLFGDQICYLIQDEVW